MKKIAVATAACLGLLATPQGLRAETGAWDLSACALYRFPGLGDFDVYDSAAGLEIQYRNWVWDVYGFGVSLGYEEWENAEGRTKWGEGTRGSVAVIPVGFGLIARPVEFPTGRLTAELGLRYAMVESDLTLDVAGARYEISLENTWLAVLSADLEGYLSDSLSVFGGVGYEKDLRRQRPEADSFRLMENEFENVFVRVGARLQF